MCDPFDAIAKRTGLGLLIVTISCLSVARPAPAPVDALPMFALFALKLNDDTGIPAGAAAWSCALENVRTPMSAAFAGTTASMRLPVATIPATVLRGRLKRNSISVSSSLGSDLGG
jgi:hypothetical protein